MPKISLNSKIAKALHGPISKDGYVLYAKAEGYNGDMEGNITQAEQSEVYRAQSQNNYNSATNIRKVFITVNRVAVQYYGVPKTSNNSGRHFIIRSYQDESIKDIAEKMFNYNRDLSRYTMEKAINSGAEKPDKYELVGNGIGALTNPYACNNIEEIYFDWSLTLSAESAHYLGILASDQYKNAYIQKQTRLIDAKAGDAIFNYFNAFNCGNLKDIRKRFPRLRLIAFISNLDDILINPNMVKVDERFSDPELSTKTWFKANEALIKASNSVISVTGINEKVSDFSIKDTQYKYDKYELKALIDAYNKKLKDYTRLKTYGKLNTDTVEKEEIKHEVVVSDLEKYLVDIENSSGLDGVKSVLSIASLHMSLKELKDTFSEFTKANREKYAKLIGLQL